MPGNVFTSIRTLATLGPFDLVLAGGLFEYLPDRHSVSLLRMTFERLLAARGHFFFTNIALGNPYRVWIEYLADWHLIHRTPHDIQNLALEAGIRTPVNIERDPTGLALLARIGVD